MCTCTAVARQLFWVRHGRARCLIAVLAFSVLGRAETQHESTRPTRLPNRNDGLAKEGRAAQVAGRPVHSGRAYLLVIFDRLSKPSCISVSRRRDALHEGNIPRGASRGAWRWSRHIRSDNIHIACYIGRSAYRHSASDQYRNDHKRHIPGWRHSTISVATNASFARLFLQIRSLRAGGLRDACQDRVKAKSKCLYILLLVCKAGKLAQNRAALSGDGVRGEGKAESRPSR